MYETSMDKAERVAAEHAEKAVKRAITHIEATHDIGRWQEGDGLVAEMTLDTEECDCTLVLLDASRLGIEGHAHYLDVYACDTGDDHASAYLICVYDESGQSVEVQRCDSAMDLFDHLGTMDVEAIVRGAIE